MFRSPLVDAAVVLFIVILFFGPKRLPMMGKSIGEGIKEFKEGIASRSSDDDDQSQITQPTTHAPVAAPRDTADSGSERSS